MRTIQGKIWKFGDAIDTDIIIPARYLTLPLDEMKEKTMEPLRPTFASDFEKGGIIVAGKNFGCGSSREQAPSVLKALGVAAVVAESFARIFYRNAINLGMPLFECEDLSMHAREGETIEIDLPTGKARLIDREMEFLGSKLPDFLLEIIEDGGLVRNLTKQRRPRDIPEVTEKTCEPLGSPTVVRKGALRPFQFEGLAILDYTAGMMHGSSVAHVTVPAGGKHPRAWSRRSDKYYFITSGEVGFEVDGKAFSLAAGDLCIVKKGSRFSYSNSSRDQASMLLVHTPAFDMESEVFEEQTSS